LNNNRIKTKTTKETKIKEENFTTIFMKYIILTFYQNPSISKNSIFVSNYHELKSIIQNSFIFNHLLKPPISKKHNFINNIKPQFQTLKSFIPILQIQPFS
jgi:hypothetical protein